MKNKSLFQKIVLIALAVAVLFALVAPAIFSQPLPAPKQEKLLNGLKVLMWSDSKANDVSVKIRIHAGSAFDPHGKEGVMQLLADNIFPNEAAREFFTEDLGGSLEIVTNYDYLQINASSKPDQFLTMLETVAAAVSNMPIDKETTVKLRNALAAKLTGLETDPSYVADQAVAKRLFGTFPYGRPRYGTPSSLQKIDFADLIDAKQRFLTADNATVAVTGNFDKTLGFRAIRRYFGGWLKSDKRVPTTFRQPDEAPTTILNIVSPISEDIAHRLAIRGVARSDKDFAASMVFTSILENRLKAKATNGNFIDLFVRNDALALPGLITIGFRGGGSELVGNSVSGPVADSEFQTAKKAFQTSWRKKDAPTHWLDADTYKLPSAEADVRSADEVTLADVNAYAERLRKSPMVSVLMSTPPSK